MARKRPTKRKKGLGDTDQPVIVTQIRNRKSVAETLFKKQGDDSVLKDVVVWGLAIGGAFFGSKFLFGVLGKDLRKAREENERDRVVTNAATPEKHPADGLALQLVKAINPDWVPDVPKQKPSAFVEADEETVFRILAGGRPERSTLSREMIVHKTGTPPLIQSREYYAEVSGRYLALTGRTLDFDLYNYLDPSYSKNDYTALKPYLAKIKCLSRSIDPRTKKITYKRLC